ncbi:sugar transferase [Dokdonia sp. PRO95]|uniref:sugar transferase n=1 Tax=Dokdonia sp. PRO95 TaxID=1239415 RepID=UPI0005524DC5|nr:sugar transferase [Dokdonia sp. PRO95]
MYKLYLKRLLDIVIAFSAFILLLPIFIVVAILIATKTKGSVFFKQKRPGLNGEIFSVLKFKTMTDECDANGKPLPDEERITKVGQFIRSTSLDEIPQLLNVIKGDMSLVGPRPLLTKYLPLYNENQARRHNVKPGITGWAQVNGRNSISWEKKFELDVWYVDNLSFILDLKVLFKTFLKVVKRDGINSDTSVSMETFTGSKD